MKVELRKVYHLKSIEQLVSEGATYNSDLQLLRVDTFAFHDNMLRMFGNDIYIDGGNFSIYLANTNEFLATADIEECATRFLKLISIDNTIKPCNFSFGLFE